MPNIDSSAYTRRQRLTVIKNANDAADSTKFRALTVFDRYDPSLVNTTAVVCNDSCRVDTKQNNTFAAQTYAASKVPHFRKTPCEPIITIDFTDQIAGAQCGFYVLYTIPTPTKSITFRYTNIVGEFLPEINSSSFNFDANASKLFINCSEPYEVNYDGDACFSTYTVWSDVEMSTTDTVTLTANSPISGILYVGYYTI